MFTVQCSCSFSICWYYQWHSGPWLSSLKLKDLFLSVSLTFQEETCSNQHISYCFSPRWGTWRWIHKNGLISSQNFFEQQFEQLLCTLGPGQCAHNGLFGGSTQTLPLNSLFTRILIELFLSFSFPDAWCLMVLICNIRGTADDANIARGTTLVDYCFQIWAPGDGTCITFKPSGGATCICYKLGQ